MPSRRRSISQIARRYNGTNNGRIAFGCRDAEKALHIGRRAALRARTDLQNRGFIVATKTGAFNLKVRHSTEWRLTEFRCDVTGAPATSDFMHWQPQVIPLPVRRKGRDHG